MADKFLDTTLASGLNDGTSIANAWQDLREVLTNTQASGSYTAGDTINIRSNDGTSDIVVDVGTASLTQANIGSESSPLRLKIDNGVHWVGDAGKLTIRHGGDTVQFRFSEHNIWESVISPTYNLHFEANGASHSRNWVMAGNNKFIGADFNRTIPAADKVDMLLFTNPGATSIGAAPSHIRFDHCRILSRENRASSSGSFPHIGLFGYAMHLDFIECDFDLTNHDANEAFLQGVSSITGSAIGSTTGSAVIRIRGGKITSPDISIQFMKYLASAGEAFRTGAMISIIGLDAGVQPLNYPHEGIGGLIVRSDNGEVITQGINGNQQMKVERLTGTVDWDPLGNYPILAAQLDDVTNTKWSTKVFPDRCGASHPFGLINISKFYNEQTISTRTITSELAIKDTSGGGGSGAYNSPQKDEWWMEITYVDNATGQYTVETTETTGALDTSVAAWVPLSGLNVTFGSNNYSRYKLEILTTNSIKPDTMIYIEVWSTKPALVADDFYFVDPDPSVV